MERVLTKVKHRAELQAASEEDQPRLRALQEVSNVQDPRRVDNKSAKQRRCGYCKQVGSGHNKASCPQRAKETWRQQKQHRPRLNALPTRSPELEQEPDDGLLLTGLGGWGFRTCRLGTQQPAAESRH